MKWNAQMIEHLERCHEDSRARRSLSARLKTALRRAGVSPACVARWTGVRERDVEFWRRGITAPPPDALNRIAGSLDLDLHWLCTGQTRLDATYSRHEHRRYGVPGTVSDESRGCLVKRCSGKHRSQIRVKSYDWPTVHSRGCPARDPGRPRPVPG